MMEQPQTKAENCVKHSKAFINSELLTMIIRGKSPPLFPSSYTTVFKRSGNQRHLIGYTWIEKDSPFSDTTVCENI